MRIGKDGFTIFDDIFELNYYLLTELELELKPNGTIFDPRKNEIFSFNGMIIKASTDPNNIHYAGQGEIEFDILGNVRLITVLFGRYLERKQEEGMPFVSFYTEETSIDDIKYSRLCVKHDTYNTTESNYYHNKCLKFIDMIFLLDEDEQIELRNFDNIIEE